MIEVGSRVVVESEKVGTPARSGVVIAVEGEFVRIRWDDEEETTFLPAAGSLRVVAPESPRRASG
jgi:hypothetical protein